MQWKDRFPIPNFVFVIPSPSDPEPIFLQGPPKRNASLNRLPVRLVKTLGAFFWDYSGIWILGIDGIRVLLGAIPFFDSRMNRMNGIRFTRNTQNTRSFGKFLAGNPTRPPAPVAWLPVGRRSSSQVTSAMSIPFSEWMSVLLEIEIPCILLFLNRNRNSQNSSKRMHPKSETGLPKRNATLNRLPVGLV